MYPGVGVQARVLALTPPNEVQIVNVVEKLNSRTYETTKFPIVKDGKLEMLVETF